jgi:type I restriction enzyme, S subunit
MMSAYPNKALAAAGVAVLDCEHRTPKAQLHGFPYIAIPDIVCGRIDLSASRRISAEDVADWTKRTVPQGGDILVTRRGRVGDSGAIPDGLRCAIGQNLVLLRSDGIEVRQDFLRWASRSPQWWSEVERLLNVGAIFSSLNVRDIARIKIPVPPVAEQRSIAGVLGALDDKIAVNIAIVTKADALAASLTRSALDTMQLLALREIALVTMGSSPPGASYNEEGEGTVFYQGVSDFGTRYPANRVWTTKPVRMAKAGDCLLSVRAPVGQLNLSGEDTCIGRGLASVRSRVGTPMTLFHLLRDAPEAWAPYEAEGTIFGSINKTQLEDLRLPTVAGELAEGLERQLGAIEASIASALDENVNLAAMRDVLLPKLMSGKIRVKDAEHMLGDVV